MTRDEFGLLKKTLPDLSASLSHEDALNELDDGPGTDDQA
jgi:hypothetical protein